MDKGKEKEQKDCTRATLLTVSFRREMEISFLLVVRSNRRSDSDSDSRQIVDKAGEIGRSADSSGKSSKNEGPFQSNRKCTSLKTQKFPFVFIRLLPLTTFAPKMLANFENGYQSKMLKTETF